MSADADKRRSATQIAALLLAMAPLVTGIYQEAQENRSRRADARATREEAAQQQRTADELADKNAAKQLAEALLGIDREGSKGERSFCNHIYLAIAQLDGEIRSPRTTTLINASLLMRNAANTRLRVCDCTIAGGVGPLWFSGFSAAGEADVAGKPSRRLVQALSSAKQECMSTECETVEAAAEEACAGDSTPSPACLGARAQQRKLCPQREADTARRVETLEALLADAQAKLAQNQQCPSSTDDYRRPRIQRDLRRQPRRLDQCLVSRRLASRIRPKLGQILRSFRELPRRSSFGWRSFRRRQGFAGKNSGRAASDQP